MWATSVSLDSNSIGGEVAKPGSIDTICTSGAFDKPKNVLDVNLIRLRMLASALKVAGSKRFPNNLVCGID